VEALSLMLSSIAVVLMIYMGLRDERRPPGKSAISLFRPIEDDTGKPRDPMADGKPRRISRSRGR
jgi:hypothetical protein